MAEYCLQCSEKRKIPCELAGETGWIEYYLFHRAAVVICEGCGTIQVDPRGRCISPDCPLHGKEK